MFRLILTIVPSVLFAGAVGYIMYSILKYFQVSINKIFQAEYIYVRFRNGELVLRKKNIIGEKEVSFIPEQEILALPAETALAITLQGQSQWFTKEGRMVANGSPEDKAISEALRFAKATGVLEVEEDLR